MGASESLYSIKDQLSLNPNVFYNYKQLKKIINFSHSKLGCLNFIDILLNHTAAESEWLNESSDSYYNIRNTKNLNSALKLDLTLKKFNEDFLDGKILSDFSLEDQNWKNEDITHLLSKLKADYLFPL